MSNTPLSTQSSPVLPDPESAEVKSRQVRRMFSQISGTYDLLNRLLSFGVDLYWRRDAVRKLYPLDGGRVLDLCGGTGDFSRAFLRHHPRNRVHLVDFALPMLILGKQRFSKTNQVSLLCSDALQLPYHDHTFDLCLCAFGIRNWSDLGRGLSEVQRVLKPGGQFAILEFLRNPGTFSDRVGKWYVQKVIPLVGQFLSGDGKAYDYLARSMEGFCSPSELEIILDSHGFESLCIKKYFLGLCWLYLVRKK